LEKIIESFIEIILILYISLKCYQIKITPVIMIVFSIADTEFLTLSNLNTIFLNACILAILACAEGVVIITRNYDVSVASMLALAAFIGFDLIKNFPNAGPVLKVNANQRYATSDVTAALFTRACRDADVPIQVFVSRNSMPCGSTIGPITATRLGIATVDVGCAQLSMHSARELCGALDPPMLAAGLTAFLSGA